MVLQKVKDLQKRERGFTIIELLIVIVIIAILAAITIVAYNGVTTKANNSTAQGNAASVRSVAEAYNADNGTYPTLAQINSYNGSTKLPSGVTLSSGTGATAPTLTLSSTNGTTTIYFQVDANGDGDCIGWYGYSNSGAIQWVYAGNASGTPTVSTTITGCAG